MVELAAQLSPLMQKAPIVSTFEGQAIAEQAEDIIRSYSEHAATYVSLAPVHDLEQRFVDTLLGSRTPKACIVANYGYGKTSAAIAVWQACCESQVVAVPPASYAAFTEIAAATYYWARRALSAYPDTLAQVEETYRTYLQSSTEELARIISRRSQHDFDQVLSVLTDPSLSNSLRLNPPATNIVLFFEALTQLLCERGYKGLAVFVDEFQQLLGKANPEVITSLRSLIWGLRTRRIPFGLFITMDPNSERVLSDRAGDILHRIKDDDLYLDFRQIYEPDFPRLLWDRYVAELNLDGLAFRIVDRPTLEALGQICERADLSNGPRTVANAFRRIATYFAETGVTYTPMQLIDDFLSGAIIFDGDTSLIASLVAEFSSYAYFRRTDAHRMVLKLLAAFPRGCPPELARRYGVAETFDEVIAELRGEVVTLLPDGYALIDLQRVGKPVDKLGLILKKYWMQIGDAEQDADENSRRFAEYIVPLLFPEGSLRTETWSSEGPPILSAEGAYRQVYSGSLHDRHPQRRVGVMSLPDDQEPSTGLDDDHTVDLTLVFALTSGASARQDASIRYGTVLKFFLDLGRVPEDGLPPELRIVEHHLSPQPCTPAVMLNVIEFVLREFGSMQLTEQERSRINRALDHMRRWVLNSLLDESVLASVDPQAATPGYRGLRDLLFRECERRFPRYHTLITTSAWQDNLATYRKAMATVSLAQRRGIEPLVETKVYLAGLFGQRSHAGFESKMRVQYPMLLEITGEAERGTLRFVPHPMETQILAYLNEGSQPIPGIITFGHAEGYTGEEIKELLALLSLRGQIQEDNGQLHRAGTITMAEAKRVGTACVRELEAFERVVPSQDLEFELELAHGLVAATSNTEVLDELVHSHLVLLMDHMVSIRVKACQRLVVLLDQQREAVNELLRSLDVSIPTFTTPVSFKHHLEGARKQLEGDLLSVRRIGSRMLESIQAERAKAASISKEEVGVHLAEKGDGISRRENALIELQERAGQQLQRVEQLRGWTRWADQLARLQLNVKTLAKWLGDADPSAGQLSLMLDELEHDVREQLAHVGLPYLERLGELQVRSDAIAREFEHSHVEREEAFARERALLEACLTDLVGTQTHLRSKYQASQHQESYHDLYAEVVQLAEHALHGYLLRIEAARTTVPKATLPAPGNSSGAPGKADRRTIRELRKAEQFFATTQVDEVRVQSMLRDEILPRAAALLQTVNATLTPDLVQANLWRDDEHLLSELTTKPRDVASVIDVQRSLSDVQPDSDLARLLRLSLSGDLTLQVKRQDRRRGDA